MFVVDDGDDVVEAVFVEVGDVVDILLAFEAVADDEDVLVDETAVVEFLYEVDIECAGGFEIDVVFEGFFHDEAEVAALGAVAVVVGAFVVGLGDGDVEEPLGALNLGAYFGQIGDLQRGSVLLNDFHEGDVVEIEFAVFGAEFVLGEFERLVDQIVILVLHCFDFF